MRSAWGTSAHTAIHTQSRFWNEESSRIHNTPHKLTIGDPQHSMFGVSGAALSKIRHMQNGGKRGRHSVDQWDRQSMFSFFFPLPHLGRQDGMVEGGRKEGWGRDLREGSGRERHGRREGVDCEGRKKDDRLTHQSFLRSTVMDRDRRLTGFLRGQTDSAKAPAGFELSNPWRVSTTLTLPARTEVGRVGGGE